MISGDSGTDAAQKSVSIGLPSHYPSSSTSYLVAVTAENNRPTCENLYLILKLEFFCVEYIGDRVRNWLKSSVFSVGIWNRDSVPWRVSNQMHWSSRGTGFTAQPKNLPVLCRS